MVLRCTMSQLQSRLCSRPAPRQPRRPASSCLLRVSTRRPNGWAHHARAAERPPRAFRYAICAKLAVRRTLPLRTLLGALAPRGERGRGAAPTRGGRELCPLMPPPPRRTEPRPPPAAGQLLRILLPTPARASARLLRPPRGAERHPRKVAAVSDRVDRRDTHTLEPVSIHMGQLVCRCLRARELCTAPSPRCPPSVGPILLCSRAARPPAPARDQPPTPPPGSAAHLQGSNRHGEGWPGDACCTPTSTARA
jgi:hypothetical protein